MGREADEWDYEDEKGEGEKEQKEREEEEENEEEEEGGSPGGSASGVTELLSSSTLGQLRGKKGQPVVVAVVVVASTLDPPTS